MSDDQLIHDIAVSFAGGQRDYVERTVEAAKALGLKRGSGHYDGQLVFSPAGTWSGSAGSMIATAEPCFDARAGEAKLELMDLFLLRTVGAGEQVFTKDEFFRRLWGRIGEQLERA